MKTNNILALLLLAVVNAINGSTSGITYNYTIIGTAPTQEALNAATPQDAAFKEHENWSAVVNAGEFVLVKCSGQYVYGVVVNDAPTTVTFKETPPANMPIVICQIRYHHLGKEMAKPKYKPTYNIKTLPDRPIMDEGDLAKLIKANS